MYKKVLEDNYFECFKNLLRRNLKEIIKFFCVDLTILQIGVLINIDRNTVNEH